MYIYKIYIVIIHQSHEISDVSNTRNRIRINIDIRSRKITERKNALEKNVKKKCKNVKNV